MISTTIALPSLILAATVSAILAYHLGRIIHEWRYQKDVAQRRLSIISAKHLAPEAASETTELHPDQDGWADASSLPLSPERLRQLSLAQHRRRPRPPLLTECTIERHRAIHEAIANNTDIEWLIKMNGGVEKLGVVAND